nr:SUMF1/EgtB/PvdO family nonheme iron enzyme [Kofleriaceae bacterium]
MSTDLDEFRLVRPLGRGGMGLVYLAHDTVLDRAVAIKMIAAHQPGAASRQRFLIEARAIARLTHPNIVSIYRVGTAPDGRPYLAQEFVRGQSLDHVARPVPWRELAEYARGLGRGVAAAHQRGILHRDLKPANVMLDDRGTIRILDFGLATLPGAEAAPPAAPGPRGAARYDPAPRDPDATRDGPVLGSTATGSSTPPPAGTAGPEQEARRAGTGHDDAGAGDAAMPVGTPRFLAPEVWRGMPASAASDLYALGVLLFELATGAPPFAQTELAALRAAVTAGAAPSLSSLIEAPAWFTGLVDRCLATDPAGRPASASEFVHALEIGLAGAGEVPPGCPYRGLRAFDAADRAVFFGRGLDVTSVLDHLRHQAMVVLVGDSGIGKSSLVHAGVGPAVLAGALGGPGRWQIVTMSPGRRPWTTACALLELDPAGDVESQLAARRGTEGLLVVVDQLEELVTLSEREEARAAAELFAQLSRDRPNVRIIATVRGDFLSRVAALPELAEPVSRGVHLLRALNEGDLRDVVVGPARLKGIEFASPTTIDSLVASVGETPGALPLLQFTLAELWSLRDLTSGQIPADALERVGGVAGALARHADQVQLALPPDLRAPARRLLLRLITPDRTRATLAASALIDGAAESRALEPLVAGRLVVARDAVDGEPTYELAHDALIAGWGTLRGWLDDQAGQRQVRQRLSRSAEEWWRDETRTASLWSRRQLRALAGTGGVDGLGDLGDRERAFVAASQRQARMEIWRRGAAVAAVVAALAATVAVVRYRASAARADVVAGRVATGLRLGEEAAADTEAVLRQREAAFAAFATGDLEAGEAAWARASSHTAAAHQHHRAAATAFELALAVDGSRRDVRARLGAALLRHADLSDLLGDRASSEDLLARAGVYASAEARAWHTPATLSISSSVTTAFTVRDAAGVVVASGRGRRALTLTLPAATYQIVLVADDGLEAMLPVRLTRGQRLDIATSLPPRAAIPAGFVYIPPGEFLMGSDHDETMRRNFLVAAPLHSVTTSAYLIGQHEVTFAEWIEFLDALPPELRERHRPSTRGGGVDLGELVRRGDRWILRMRPTTVMYEAGPGQPLVFPARTRRREVRWEQTPVVAVDWADVQAFTRWLASTGRVPGARPCTEAEWERAARGADGRAFPHGDTVGDDDANLDVTYGRDPLGFGPDEVGSHRKSNSPFGLADMLGNVWEWVAGPSGPVTRGAGWYHGASSGLTMNRDLSDP